MAAATRGKPLGLSALATNLHDLVLAYEKLIKGRKTNIDREFIEIIKGIYQTVTTSGTRLLALSTYKEKIPTALSALKELRTCEPDIQAIAAMESLIDQILELI